MFKIICEINKVKPDSGDAILLVYKNCKPCSFSDYQMFEGVGDPVSRALKAYLVASQLEVAGIDITKPEYKNLANKIYYINDFTDYKYITLFDESTEVANVKNYFGVTWLYSGIFRLIKPDFSSAIFHNTFSYLESFFINAPMDGDNNKEAFKTIWEKYFLFSIPPTVIHERLPGTVIKAEYNDNSGKQYYAIDYYFLKFLFSGQENSKCHPLISQMAAAEIESVNSEQIYDEFKAQLPKLVGLEYLNLLSRVRSCVNNETRVTRVLHDETDKFTLNSVSKVETFAVHTLIALCTKLEGLLMPISYVVDYASKACTDAVINEVQEEYIQVFSLVRSNELYSINCDNFNQTIEAIGNIEDYYLF